MGLPAIVWGYGVPRCPACGTDVGPDFQFCHVCGATLRPVFPAAPPHVVYPPAASAAAPRRVLWGARTKRGIALTIVSLVILWIPNATIFGGLLLSIGSTLMFWDRHPFRPAHRRSIRVAYLLFWIAAAGYAVLFIAFVSTAYAEWSRRGTLDDLRPMTVLFVWLSTGPTELLVLAIALQIRHLLPDSLRPQALWATIALAGLVLLATILAHLEFSPGMGSEVVRLSSVLGVLDRISVLRLVEGPGFAWFAYLYYRAHGAIVPKAAPAGQGAPSIPGP